jgi:hypothetical protein
MALGLAVGDLDQVRGDVDADDGEAAADQLQGVAAGAAGEVEDSLATLGAEDLQGAVDFGDGALGPGHVGRVAVEGGAVPVLRNLLGKNGHSDLPAAPCRAKKVGVCCLLHYLIPPVWKRIVGIGGVRVRLLLRCCS